MTAYFLIACILFLLGNIDIMYKLKENVKTIFLILIGIVLILFSSLAISRGDANAYLFELFNYSNDYEHIEIGYRYLNIVIKNIFGHVFFVFLFIAILNSYFKFKFYKNMGKYYFVSIFILFTTTFITQEMGALRFSVATSFFLMAILSLSENKKILFFIFIIVGSLFHMSIIVGIFIYFIRNIEVSKKKITIITISLFSLYILKIDIFTVVLKNLVPILGTYGAKAYGYTVLCGRAELEVGLIKRIVLLLFLLYISKKKEIFNPIIVNTYFISICIYLVFAPVNLIAQRFSIFFGSVEPIIVVYIIESFNKKQRNFIYWIIALVHFFILYRTLLVFSDDVNTWIPYKTFFF